MDTEETEGYVLRRRPYIQLEVGIVLCLVSLGLGEEKDIKKKTADISRRGDWYSREVTSKELQQKFHTDDISVPKNASEWS